MLDYINPQTKSKKKPSNKQKSPAIQENKKVYINRANKQACDDPSAICTMINNIRHCALPNQSYTKCGQKILNPNQQAENEYNNLQQALDKAYKIEYNKCMAVGQGWLASKGVGVNDKSGVATILALTAYQAMTLNCQKSPYKHRQSMQRELGINLD